MLQTTTPLLTDHLALHARWKGNSPAIIAASGTLDWVGLERRTNQVANALLALGVVPGDRVGLVMDNDLAMVESIFGTLKAGCTTVPLNPSVADASLDRMLRDAGATAVIATPEHAPRLARAAGVHYLLASVAGRAGLPDWLDYATLTGEADTAPPIVRVSPGDLCNIIYSSGTTGDPKGIVHDHLNRVNWAYDVAAAVRSHASMRALSVTGLYSNITWAMMLPTVLLGGTWVIHREFDPAAALDTIERERITHIALVPVLYQRLLDDPGFATTKLDSLQSALCVGSPLPVPLKQKLFEVLPSKITDFYGLTEGFLTNLPPEEAPGRWASVGRPLPGSDLHLIGTGDRPVTTGEPGEITGRSRYLMNGYWNKPEATAAATWIDPSGQPWLRTGDIGRLDADGYLYIVDRKKDMIISGGANIYPADLEAVLAAHPDVAECTVLGIPSQAWGETPLAVVVPKDGTRPDGEELRNWANRQLGRQQRISALTLHDALPRNANGKVLKRELRDEYVQRSTEPPAPASTGA